MRFATVATLTLMTGAQADGMTGVLADGMTGVLADGSVIARFTMDSKTGRIARIG